MTREEIQEIIKSVEDGSSYRGYPKRVEVDLCRLALKGLASQGLVEKLKEIESQKEMTRLADCCVEKSCHINSDTGICSFQTGVNYGNADQAARATEAIRRFEDEVGK